MEEQWDRERVLGMDSIYGGTLGYLGWVAPEDVDTGFLVLRRLYEKLTGYEERVALEEVDKRFLVFR